MLYDFMPGLFIIGLVWKNDTLENYFELCQFIPGISCVSALVLEQKIIKDTSYF